MSTARSSGRVDGAWQALFSRRDDRVPSHVPDVELGLNDRVAPVRGLALASQQIGLQSIYFLLPGIVAAAFGGSALDATNMLCLSLLGLALYAVLQGLTKGPVGSGYPLVAAPSATMMAPMLLAAGAGQTLGQAAAMVVITGIAAMLFAPMTRRLTALLPTEVTGVVVFMVGASLLPTMMTLLHVDPASPGEAVPGSAVAFGCFALMVVIAVLRTRFAAYAVLIGAAAGTAVSMVLGMTPEGAHDLLVAAPWFALPTPAALPDFSFDPTLLVAFLVTLVPSLASMVGVLVAFQRATDGGWTRADPGPIRRGILGHGLAVALGGSLGALTGGASASCVALSIATRSFARGIALIGSGILFLIAFCPKAVALFILVPAPVQAAMLLYVAGFMMAQGCAMVVLRTLDTRRTVVAGLGLTAGLSVLTAPGFFAAAVPALASPLAMGALVAFLANLVTLPLVRRVQRFYQPFGAGMGDMLQDRAHAIGGAWGLRPETVRKMHHALAEFGDLLAGRGLVGMTVVATQADEAVHLTVAFRGAPLPTPARRPNLDAIEAGGDAMEAVSLWLALREATSHGTRSTAEGQELHIEFQD
ncbi:hypothetical protein GXW78_22105 [Roseomonas terrae]|jgi:xanthine permease XanP|uniref:Xanthine/uracil/vitamin C permease n=1 Tax=Neoroseomonas terrae TaxID=424799 RepID=A0ABS5EMX0_9PROT|nr:solute carrier family 23 protein [Neoroseomonas terrae]MBR0652366.1 hypothetical protein [Neoroseomonas terrae]